MGGKGIARRGAKTQRRGCPEKFRVFRNSVYSVLKNKKTVSVAVRFFFFKIRNNGKTEITELRVKILHENSASSHLCVKKLLCFLHCSPFDFVG